MEIYIMNADGSGVKRLTNTRRAGRRAVLLQDGSLIVWRGKRSRDPKELTRLPDAAERRACGGPTDLEIFVMNSDGPGMRQVTNLGGSNFAPFIHPDGKRIIFASNQHDPKGRNFDLYLSTWMAPAWSA